MARTPRAAAHAWDEPVPRTVVAALRIAAKANDCCSAIGGSSKTPDACKRKTGLTR
jgi:hypothetical protein